MYLYFYFISIYFYYKFYFENFPSKGRLYFINLDKKKICGEPSAMLFSNDKSGYLSRMQYCRDFQTLIGIVPVIYMIFFLIRNKVSSVLNIYAINVRLGSRSKACRILILRIRYNMNVQLHTQVGLSPGKECGFSLLMFYRNMCIAQQA